MLIVAAAKIKLFIKIIDLIWRSRPIRTQSCSKYPPCWLGRVSRLQIRGKKRTNRGILGNWTPIDDSNP
jgi:hypothetical protein